MEPITWRATLCVELDLAGTVERGENRHQTRRDKCKGAVAQKFADKGVRGGREVARGKRGREEWEEWMDG